MKAQRPAQSAKSPRKAKRSCGNQDVSTTTNVAPTTVPIIRNHPLRSEAPSCGWHTTAADVPAQNGLSSSSQNARKRARQTEVHSRNAKSSGSRLAATTSVRLTLYRGDSALVCIHFAPHSPWTTDDIFRFGSDQAAARQEARASSIVPVGQGTPIYLP